jgi:8-oxo-dGTP pyrophosphatase MutT (NUDIX family)
MSEEFVGVNPDLIRPISDEEQEKRGWTLEVNGEVIPVVHEVRLFNEKMGLESRYGMRAEGFDGLLDHEPGGGGSVIVPWVKIGGMLYVGMLHQNRPTQYVHPMDSVWNVPRGYLDPGETHLETTTREFREETESTRPEGRIVALPGLPINSNSARFDTSREGEGAKFYAFEVLGEEVKRTYLDDDPEVVMHGLSTQIDTYKFNEEIVSPVSKGAERIMGCYFFPWWEASRVGDMFTRAIVSTLMAMLESKNE